MDTTASLLAHIASQRQQAIETAQTLVQAASPNPPGDVSASAAAAVEAIRRLVPSADVGVHETKPGIVNVVAVIQGRQPGKTVVFNGHLDTYPIGDEAKWTYPPLGGALSPDGQRLYGRGGSDMKGGIAASIIASSALYAHRDTWDGKVVVALAGDEETMGTNGSAYLLDNVPSVHCDAMICGDAGSPMVVRAGEKGFVWVEVRATGAPAHGAHVHRGVNAIDRLLEAVSRLKQLEQIPVDAPKEVSDAITAAKDVSEPFGGAGEDDTLRRVTVNLGTIRGGTSPNLVPDEASAAADIRLPKGASTEMLLKSLHSSLEPLEGVSYKVLRRSEPSWTSPAEPIVKYALEAARQVVSEKAVVNMRVGASDSRLFRAKGIPTVVVGLTPYNMGGPDEYFHTEELSQVAGIHALTAWRFLQSEQP